MRIAIIRFVVQSVLTDGFFSLAVIGRLDIQSSGLKRPLKYYEYLISDDGKWWRIENIEGFHGGLQTVTVSLSPDKKDPLTLHDISYATTPSRFKLWLRSIFQN